VVFPQAEAKFFLTATAEERARRRVIELRAAGRTVDPVETLAELRARDHRDTTRAVAPLRKADDAVEIDSSGMGPDAVLDRMVEVVRSRGG
jgi:cytidylate kinase